MTYLPHLTPDSSFPSSWHQSQALRVPWRSLIAVGIASLLILTCVAQNSEAQEKPTRILVNKRLRVSGSPPAISFQPLAAGVPTKSGFSAIGEYVAQILYEGPEGSAAQFRGDVTDQGFEIDTETDLNYVSFHDHVIDPESGVATPPYPSDSTTGNAFPQTPDGDALFLLVLKGPPAEPWRNDLQAKGIVLVEALPPVTYLARGNASLVRTLPGSTTYVRNAFPVLPNMKTLPFPEAVSETPFRPVWVQAVEESPSDSILPHLASIAQGAVERGALAGRSVLYRASLTELDARVVSTLAGVYGISADGQVSLASERQGILIIQPDATRLPRITTPPSSPNYAAVLISKGVTDFSNTKIGMLDTGFDDGTNSHPDFQAGGPQVTVHYENVWADGADRNTHGTLVASALVGFAPFGSARKDAESYRYTLGLAESCRLVSAKLIQCGGMASLMVALQDTPEPSDLVAENVNIINMSYELFNCQYDINSVLVDTKTRSRNWLFTIAAGNDVTPLGGNCHKVGAPGTAKNGITVGATNNYTPQSLGWLNCPPSQNCAGQGRVAECHGTARRQI